jgi:hypothetical protein
MNHLVKFIFTPLTLLAQTFHFLLLKPIPSTDLFFSYSNSLFFLLILSIFNSTATHLFNLKMLLMPLTLFYRTSIQTLICFLLSISISKAYSFYLNNNKFNLSFFLASQLSLSHLPISLLLISNFYFKYFIFLTLILQSYLSHFLVYSSVQNPLITPFILINPGVNRKVKSISMGLHLAFFSILFAWTLLHAFY